jgi:hypothetical protein
MGDTAQETSHCNNSEIQNNNCSTSLLHTGVAHRKKHYPIGLWRRGAIWQFRKRVPHDVMTMFGHAVVSVSLKTADYRLAVKLAVKVTYEWDLVFDQLRANRAADIAATVAISVPIVPNPVVQNVANVAEPFQPLVIFGGQRQQHQHQRSITIKELYQRYMADPAIARSPKTLIAYQSIYARVLGFYTDYTHYS